MRNKKKIKVVINKIKKEYLLETFFIVSNLINGLIIRAVTVKNPLFISPFVVDLGFLILITTLLLLTKRQKRVKYIIILSILFNIICIVNSIYYHYYSSFASLSLVANIAFAKDVSDAIFENVLKPIDLIYLWQIIALIIIYKITAKRKVHQPPLPKKKIAKVGLLSTISLFILGAIFMPMNAWNRLHSLWNRESVVMNYGIYVYQMDDIIQSLTPEISSILGHDKALKKVKEYYEENKYTPSNNEYTNIFEGKNVIVLHAESMQQFPMNLTFNNKEVTPNLNKLAKEGIFFSNFYSQVGVGTSSDAEFTFNTSMMPSTKGTVFVNYFDREYISIPKLLKEKNYYTYSMHANTGEFWNRNTMHKTLGYDKFYSKDSYTIDETIGLGLSDKSFFKQSVAIMKQIKETENKPFYGLLIMLSNHTPFSDLELMDEYPTTIDVTIDNQTITREYLNDTTMGNYLRSVHYADSAIGEFINELDEEGLLDNTVLVIYGDHDARLDYDDYNLLYNYDPITDKIKTEEDSGYISYGKYNYELDRKVPLIIWTKNKEYKINIDKPMGMIDVLPTLGNMLGIHSDYQLGKDLLNLTEDNTVTFIDGSFLTSEVYYNAPKGEIYSINNAPINEEYIRKKAKESKEIIEISNDIISYNFIKEIRSQRE